MKQIKVDYLIQGLTTAFIDLTVSSNLAYRPQFVSNNYKEGRKVISSIEDELLSCEQFAISVIYHDEWNYAATSDIKRTGEAGDSGADFDNGLFDIQ